MSPINNNINEEFKLTSNFSVEDVERGKLFLTHLEREFPGSAYELRIPSFMAINFGSGETHRRGRPTTVIEIPFLLFIDLVDGKRNFSDIIEEEDVYLTGEELDLDIFLKYVREKYI